MPARLQGCKYLLDMARLTTFESADKKDVWIDVARDNRRLFLLGFRWDF